MINSHKDNNKDTNENNDAQCYTHQGAERAAENNNKQDK